MYGSVLIGLGLVLMSGSFLLTGVLVAIGRLVSKDISKPVVAVLKYVFGLGGTIVVFGVVLWLGEFGYRLIYP